MRQQTTISGLLLLGLSFGIFVPRFAQDTPAQPTASRQERQMVGIALVRTINTQELTYRSKYGSYATWQSLVSGDPKIFETFLSRNGLNQTSGSFGNAPEILPGWNLRLNVHVDGQGYDLLLQDTNDKTKGYAAFSDERGAIWECKWLR
jgi:hypothetical protein